MGWTCEAIEERRREKIETSGRRSENNRERIKRVPARVKQSETQGLVEYAHQVLIDRAQSQESRGKASKNASRAAEQKGAYGRQEGARGF